jgi:hypothetical protein
MTNRTRFAIVDVTSDSSSNTCAKRSLAEFMCQSHYITLASSAGATIDFRTTIDDVDALSNQARLLPDLI